MIPITETDNDNTTKGPTQIRTTIQTTITATGYLATINDHQIATTGVQIDPAKPTHTITTETAATERMNRAIPIIDHVHQVHETSSIMTDATIEGHNMVPGIIIQALAMVRIHTTESLETTETMHITVVDESRVSRTSQEMQSVPEWIDIKSIDHTMTLVLRKSDRPE